MENMYRRFLSACTGAFAGVLVMGIAFAASPTIKEEDNVQKENTFYELSSKVTADDLAELSQYMDKGVMSYIEDTLVEDQPSDIVITYGKYDPAFEKRLMQYMQSK